MRFLVIGAGALGGYYGGVLMRGGADVSFLVRPQRAAKLAENGLVIRFPDGEFRTPVKTVQAGAIEGRYDVALLTCKAYDLGAAIDDFATALAPGGAALPFLNGIKHLEVLGERLGIGRVLGGVTQFLVTQSPNGDITPSTHGTGKTLFGELNGERSARSEKIHAALAAGQANCTLSETIRSDMWSKFFGAGTSFAVAGLAQARASEVAAAPAGAALVARIIEECAGVCSAEGHAPPDWVRDFLLQMWTTPGSNYGPSLLAEIENSRPTEGEHVVGDLVNRADRLGLDTPMLRASLCCLQIYESRRHAKLVAG